MLAGLGHGVLVCVDTMMGHGGAWQGGCALCVHAAGQLRAGWVL